MIAWLYHYLSGFLYIEMAGYSPERFFNLCSAHGVEVWDIADTGRAFRFFMTARGFKDSKALMRKAKVRLKVIKKLGLPFFLYRNRKRKLYGAGVAAFFLLLFFLSQFVWDIEFEGNYRYTYDTLLKFCETEDIRYGMWKAGVDCDGLEEALRTEFSEITWVSARVSGTRLLVKIKENEVLSQIPDKDESPRDIIADKDGTITSIIVRQGVPVVKAGDQIAKGDLLVSGTLEVIGDDEAVMNTHYVHADADIEAETVYSLKKNLPLFRRVDTETGKVRNGRYLKFLDFSLLLILPKPGGTTWKSTMEEEQFHLFESFYLPVYMGKITSKEYITYERPYTQEEKEQEAEAYYQQAEKNLLEKGVHILKNHVRILDNESLCQIEVEITAREKIGIGADIREETN